MTVSRRIDNPYAPLPQPPEEPNKEPQRSNPARGVLIPVGICCIMLGFVGLPMALRRSFVDAMIFFAYLLCGATAITLCVLPYTHRTCGMTILWSCCAVAGSFWVPAVEPDESTFMAFVAGALALVGILAVVFPPR